MPERGSARSSETQILVADDDPAVLRVIVRALSPYRVLGARNAAEGWTLGRSICLNLLITDYLMPDGTADDLIGRLRAVHPALRVLVLTGHAAVPMPSGWSAGTTSGI